MSGYTSDTKERLWTESKLQDLEFLIKKVERENEAQLAKWGVQQHTVAGWALILGEEYGELMKELCESNFGKLDIGRLHRVFSEAIQTATLALKIAEMAMKEGA